MGRYGGRDPCPRDRRAWRWRCSAVNFSVLSARGYTRLIMWVGAGALGSTVVAILVAYPFGLVATVAHLPSRRSSSRQ